MNEIKENDFGDGSILIMKATQELDHLTRCLYSTGNTVLAEKLEIISTDIETGSKEMNNAYSC